LIQRGPNGSERGRPLRLLTFTTLFPNAAQPAHGVFVWRRLRQLIRTGLVQATVVAPVPWFPSTAARFGAYATLAKVPAEEDLEGTKVYHPRFPVIPRVGANVTPASLALRSRWFLHNLMNRGLEFDLIDAHYFFPDGVAAAFLGSWLNKPVVITARGTDINLIPRNRLARFQILQAARSSSACIAVCQALKDEMIRIGVAGEKVTVLRNGVDLDHFRPIDRDKARQELGLDDSKWLLSVGLLIERKGHDVPIAALKDCPGWKLMVVGSGPLRSDLEQLARSHGVADRVLFVGLVSQADLPKYYSAADISVLASSREGWANVLLESMACGTPVIASDVWGTPEVVARPAAGELMDERNPKGFVRAFRRLLDAYPARAETRAYAERFDWEPTTRGQLEIFRGVVREAS
jgi:teichuronic acid biosynthesis glycosyltransferase TuaC